MNSKRTLSEEFEDSEEQRVKLEKSYNVYQYLNLENCNIQNLCRICLTTNHDMVSLLEIGSTEKSELLADMFTSLTSLQIHPDDGLPPRICNSCKAQIVHCYEFKIKCLNSDCTLKYMLQGESFTKEETCDYEDVPEIETNDDNLDGIETKDETDINEDIQYIEDINDDVTSESETLCIVQNTNLRKKEMFKITITDSKSLLEKVVSKKKFNEKKNKYSCSYCSKKFLKVKALKNHIKNKHDSATYPHSCDNCKDSFSSEHDLHIHSALHSKGTSWTCNKCHKEFNAKAMLRRHIQRHMQSKRYACESCGKSFVELYALRRHLRVHTGELVEKKHACHICDKRYSESGLLAAHVARHSGARPCVCAACGKAFPSARLLASHHRVHTDRKPHACLYCDKRFRHESTRNTHHRTHTGEKPYVCSVCGKTFIQNSNLTLHMRTHTGEKPYSCDMCERRFTSGSTLKTHQRTHTGEKPYSCHVCGKRFARMDLTTHMRHHTGERPYHCSACPKRFVSAARLRDHCRIHTGEKPFECALCIHKFATKSHLVKHMKTHQKKKKAEKREVVILQQVDFDQPIIMAEKFMITDSKENNGEVVNCNENTSGAGCISNENVSNGEITLAVAQDMPLEVSGELVLQDDSEIKTEVLIGDGENNADSFQNDNVCVSDVNYGNDVNLVTVNEGEVSISASSAMLEGATVKLYQLDQSLVQIHSSGGQVTISKITSKMTANF